MSPENFDVKVIADWFDQTWKHVNLLDQTHRSICPI